MIVQERDNTYRLFDSEKKDGKDRVRPTRPTLPTTKSTERHICLFYTPERPIQDPEKKVVASKEDRDPLALLSRDHQQQRDRQADRLHISQLEIDLVVKESPLVASELALQLLLRKRLELLLRNSIEINLGKALADGVCDAFVAGALGLEAGELVEGGTRAGSGGASVR